MSTSKNVLLTTSSAPSQSPFSTTEKRPPLGIGFLISVLKNAGHSVFFIDNYLSPSNYLETDYLQRNSIDFVGIYANTICFRDTLRMIYRLDYFRKSGLWNGKIIVGGPHTTVSLETIPACVDYIVQGEGEEAILDIIDGKVKSKLVSYPRIQNLDTLPMPAWDYFIHQQYNWEIEFIQDKPIFTMNTSRGCPFECTFCSVGSIWGRKYTYFSAERIVSDIEYVIDHYGAKGIYFREDNFTCNRKRLVKFCNLLIEKGINIPWVCESRVNTLDRDLITLMQHAGVRGFYFGVESGSQRILDFLKKGITLEQTRETFKLCHEYDIKTAASIIVKVPTETDDDLRLTMELLDEIKPTVTWFNVFVGIPNSELYQYSIDNKLYEFIDDRGLLYFEGHNDSVKKFYNNSWNAQIPVTQNKPDISVIMSVYNDITYLDSAIQSILSQTFQNFELIIVNDGSTDGTQDILHAYRDPRIIILENLVNIGLTRSLNMALSCAKGKYIARMDSDDISLPHRFESQFEFLENHPDHALLGSSYYQINTLGEVEKLIQLKTDHDEIVIELKTANHFGHGTVMFRKDIVTQLGGYNERYKYAQDYDLWLRISENYLVGNLNEPLYYWRLTDGSISSVKATEQKYFADLAKTEAVVRSNNKPTVSVIVPTYNRPDTLAKALSSIINQTFQDFEIIVVNDAGEDVHAIVEEYNSKNNIIYISHEDNKGLAATRNTGILSARGKYIAYLDDDDIFYTDHLETLFNFLESNNDFQVAYTDANYSHQVEVGKQYIEINREVKYSFDFDYERILYENFVPIICIMHRKSCLNNSGNFDSSLRRLEDWDLLIRLSRKSKFAHIKNNTCEVSWRSDGTSMTNMDNGAFPFAYINISYKYKDYMKGETLKKRNANVFHELRIVRDILSEGLLFNHKDSYKSLGFNNLTFITQQFAFLKRQYSEDFQKLFLEILGLLFAYNDNYSSYSQITSQLAVIEEVERQAQASQLAEREQVLEKLKGNLAERDQIAQKLTGDLAERDQAVQRLTGDVAERDQAHSKELQRMNAKQSRLEQEYNTQVSLNAKLEQSLNFANHEIVDYYNSTSWKMTRPFRWISKRLMGRNA